MRFSITLWVLWLSIPAARAELIPTAAGGKRFQIPAGFQLEVVAASALVEWPIHAAFDDQGRLYVTDSSGTNDKVQVQMEHALTYALIELDSPVACRQALGRTSVTARKVALTALDQMESADLTAVEALRFTHDTDT